MADNRIRFIFEINDAGKAKVKGLTKDFVSLDNAINKVNVDLKRQAAEMNKTGKSTNNMVDKTGLAGATLVELSRTISDSNYGFTAMANNISQLSTLFITLIASTGGLGNGLRELKKAFMGPLGLIVIFNIAVAAFERLAMKAKSTKKELDNLKGGLGDVSGDLETFVKLIDRGDLSSRDLDESLIALKKTYPELNIEIGENGRLTKESRIQIEEKIKKVRELAKAQAIQKELQKTFSDRVKLELKQEEDIAELRKAVAEGREKEFRQLLRTTKTGLGIYSNSLKERIQAVKDANKEEFDLFDRRETSLLKKLEDTSGSIAGAFGGKDDPFVIANEIRAQSFKDLGKEIEITTEEIERSDVKRVRSSKESAVNILAASAELTNGLSELFGQQTEAGKAFAVMTATFDTYVAANRTLSDPYFLGRPYERFIATAAIVVTGLANVKNILTADKNGPRGSSTNAAGAGSSQAPIFNVVGQSNVDQIGRSIATARQEPLRAYVVESDITSAQQLENARIQQASIG